MINQLRLKNFKCFEDNTIPFGGLTLLAGLNGTGKSSIIQALLLLRQSGLDANGNPANLHWRGELVNVGSFRDVLKENAAENLIELEASFGELGLVRMTVNNLDVDRPMLSKGFPKAYNTSLYRPNMFYVSADRLGPRKALEFIVDGQEPETPLGKNGEHVLEYLAQNERKPIGEMVRHDTATKNTLWSHTNAWLKTISPDVELDIQLFQGADLARSVFSFAQVGDVPSRPFRATNVGFGLSYALPLLVALLAAEADDLVIIENPEAHLHPGGQTKLAELAARAVAGGAQIILETHSDHILDGVRLAVRDTIVEADNVAIHYFERDGMDVQVTTPVLNSSGKLDIWPPGFFDQQEINLARLITSRDSSDDAT